METLETITHFVRHSNRIEGEPTEPGHPLYDDHLAVALYIAKGIGFGPEQIHARLMASQPHVFPGELRQCRVSVDGKEKMSPLAVRPAMRQLSRDLLIGTVRTDAEAWCWDRHHRFEHIHPFTDGNGRTGRLLLNMLRLRYGLPWLTVNYEDRFAYYRSIQEWEHNHEL